MAKRIYFLHPQASHVELTTLTAWYDWLWFLCRTLLLSNNESNVLESTRTVDHLRKQGDAIFIIITNIPVYNHILPFPYLRLSPAELTVNFC